MRERKCRSCKESKPLRREFVRKHTGIGGYGSTCKKCVREAYFRVVFEPPRETFKEYRAKKKQDIKWKMQTWKQNKKK